MTDYDLRQLRRMRERIEWFENQKIGLGSLIGDLGALLDCLEATDGEWKDRFRRQWWELELVYAVALDRKLERLPAQSQAIVDDAIRAMKSLLDERGDIPDDSLEDFGAP